MLIWACGAFSETAKTAEASEQARLEAALDPLMQAAMADGDIQPASPRSHLPRSGGMCPRSGLVVRTGLPASLPFPLDDPVGGSAYSPTMLALVHFFRRQRRRYIWTSFCFVCFLLPCSALSATSFTRLALTDGKVP